MSQSIKMDKLTLGVCYYPEHWDRELWEDDLKRMEASGISVIRIAEFAWNKFEPREGEFQFDFFDDFMKLLSRTPIKVIFCTPTATPPAWASETYPEILNAKRDGVLYHHGLRRHYNYNSLVYQRLSCRIVEKLAQHYKDHPSIIGWQLDNEFNCELSEYYSQSDTFAFRRFLQEKYGNLEVLNAAWGTVFWNQDYSEWEQVHLPRVTPNNDGNPHQQLDYIRFISESTCRYAKMQADILRKYLPKGIFITTNGIYGNIDNHKMTQESLDFITYDSYPNFAFALDADPKNSNDLNDRKWSMYLAEARSISSNFGIMEQQSGPGGWVSRMESPAPKPGQMTLWTMQSIAHGADFVSYFRWRTCTVGTEIYWHGILDYDNRPNRRQKELRNIHQLTDKLDGVTGSRYAAGFAMLREYDNIWDAQDDLWHQRVEAVSQQGWFNAAQLLHSPMDYLYVYPNTTLQQLKQYPVLIYPHITILHEKTAELLKEYVHQGGTLLTGCRSGYKDNFGHCTMKPMPGLLAEVFGCEVEEFTFMGPNDDPVNALWDGKTVEAPVFHDILQPTTGEVLAHYDGDYYMGRAALVWNRFGEGNAYFFGSAFNTQSAMRFLTELNLAKPYRELIELPQECELAVRKTQDLSYYFILNYSKDSQNIKLHKELLDCLAGKRIIGVTTLGAYGVLVLSH